MVAYSFQSRFATPILAGTKAQTIRADRKRHARPGEELQLYIGMRTKHCRLIARVTCVEVAPVRLLLARGRAVLSVLLGDIWLDREAIENFARADGFADGRDMAEFWFDHHGRGVNEIDFRGMLLCWNAIKLEGMAEGPAP